MPIKTMTPEATKIILMAARRFIHLPDTNRAERTHRGAVLQTLSEVAADVLDLHMTPFGFSMALQETMAKAPRLGPVTQGIDAAQRNRAAWEAHVLDTMADLLGLSI